MWSREGWQPEWFVELWKTERIAILTYRKHTKDDWAGSEFSAINVTLKNGEVSAM